MTRALDPFIPDPEVRERFATTVRAPAALVIEVARDFDMRSPLPIRAIFRLREILMRAPRGPRRARGLLEETTALGWGVLTERPDLIVCGSACRPWRAEPGFRPIAAEGFAEWAEPGWVKIAWTLEAEELAPVRTRFHHETRAVATDLEARKRFRRYWRWARFGIVAIRMLWLPAVRRAAEKRWAAERRERDR